MIDANAFTFVKNDSTNLMTLSSTSQTTTNRAISAVHSLNLTALTSYLHANLKGFEGPIEAEPFKGGQSNPTYRLTTPNAVYVMRTKPGPVARLLPSAHAIEREFKVMRALERTNVPVPKMLCLCEDESIIGFAFYVMEFIEGRILWDPALPGFEKYQRKSMYEEMNRTIAALHMVDYGACGLDGYGRPGNYFERQIARWSKQYRASITQPIAEMDWLIKWLPEHIPPSNSSPSLSTIVHGDFRLDNLLFHPTEPRILAVLDWELSTLGHPLADFSYHCLAWHIPPGLFRGLGGMNIAELGIPSEEEYIRAYCDNTGIFSFEEVQTNWNFYLAYNLFRLAAILQGIAKRVESGTASSDQAVSSAAGAPRLAKLAWEFAQKAP